MHFFIFFSFFSFHLGSTEPFKNLGAVFADKKVISKKKIVIGVLYVPMIFKLKKEPGILHGLTGILTDISLLKSSISFNFYGTFNVIPILMNSIQLEIIEK